MQVAGRRRGSVIFDAHKTYIYEAAAEKAKQPIRKQVTWNTVDIRGIVQNAVERKLGRSAKNEKQNI